MLSNTVIIVLIVLITLNTFLIGYLFGKFSFDAKTPNNPKSFFKQQTIQNESSNKNDISIDDKKVVIDIKTDGLEKKYDSLGEVKHSQENISNSVNKLKNLKR